MPKSPPRRPTNRNVLRIIRAYRKRDKAKWYAVVEALEEVPHGELLVKVENRDPLATNWGVRAHMRYHLGAEETKRYEIRTMQDRKHLLVRLRR